MKILVAVKRVVDPKLKVRVKQDLSGPDLEGLHMAINPFCKIAVERAVELRDTQADSDSEVVAVSVGSKQVEEQLRYALAAGADRAIRVAADDNLESVQVATLLSQIVKDENPDVVVLGKLAMDGDNAQTGPMLAALLDAPLANCACWLSAQSDYLLAICREDTGEHKVMLPYPVVVTADLGLAKPRLVNLAEVMKARKRPLMVKSPLAQTSDSRAHRRIDGFLAPKGLDRNTQRCTSAHELANQVLKAAGGRL